MKKTTESTNNAPQFPPTATITGTLCWRNALLKEDCRSIAICVDGEPLPADDKGQLPLRTIVLNIDATPKFEAVFGRYVLMGSEVKVEVITSDLAADLANKKGARGTKTVFIATDFSF